VETKNPLHRKKGTEKKQKRKKGKQGASTKDTALPSGNEKPSGLKSALLQGNDGGGW